jgi:Ser/Thr protein kinase RdoA (MazF antagonist)
LRKAFLQGYCEVAPLAPESAAHINDFLAARWTMICLFLARRPENKPRLDRVLEIVVPKLKRFLREPGSLG